MGRTYDLFAAIAFALICSAGSLRFVLGVDYIIYYGAIALLACLMAMQVGSIRVDGAILLHTLAISVLSSWLILSSSWTISSVQWQTDVYLLIALGMVSTFTATLGRAEVLPAFFVSLTVAGLIVGIFVLLDSGLLPVKITSSRRVIDAYLTVSSTIGAALIISTVHALHAASSYRKWALLASIVLMVALSQSLARGALLSSIGVVLSVGVMHILTSAAKRRRLLEISRRYILFVGPLVVGLIYLALTVERTRIKLERMLSPEQELESGGRGQVWENAINFIVADPISGYGLGSSGIIAGGHETGYPHNFVFQLWLDGGVLAAALGIGIIFVPLLAGFRTVLRSPADVTALSLFGVLTFYVAEFSKSYSIYTGRPLLIFAMLTLIYATTARSDEPA